MHRLIHIMTISIALLLREWRCIYKFSPLATACTYTSDLEQNISHSWLKRSSLYYRSRLLTHV